MSFAVVDFETTGILPSYHHRVVEIGVTLVGDDGAIGTRWETLINPQRDLGAQSIHGIRAADIYDAPLFSDVVAEFAGLLQGRVLVAHNAPFDRRFLEAEFARAGYPLRDGVPTLCTMALGARFGLGGSTSLAHACTAFEIDPGRAHSAGADAHAAALLLAHYRRVSAAWAEWPEYWEGWSSAGRDYQYPILRPSGVPAKRRSDAGSTPTGFLERISAETPLRDVAPGAEASYLALLDRCLLDGHVSVSEGAQLADVATELGLSREAVLSIHRRYLAELEHRAWADGTLTEREKADLRAVGALLRVDESHIAAAVDDVPPDSEALDEREAFTLAPGDLIVLTGEMTRERSAWEAELRARGFAPHSTVTKKVKLVVAADPDSLSGKAKKARDYGIPIVGEQWLMQLLA